MPLPLILGIGAAAAGIAGIGAGIRGATKIHDAKTKMEDVKKKHERHMASLENHNRKANESMDNLGKLEMEVLKDFSTFADLIERIQNRPDFASIEVNGTQLPHYTPEDIKQVSIGAGVLLGGLTGAGLGVAGGFAAAGATSAAVMALGTASTGVAISSLSGAALTNATLAALGGGALAAGGGGVALGSTILGASTLGVGLLIGGIIFNFTGSKLSDKADEAETQMLHMKAEIKKSCEFLINLETCAKDYRSSIYLIYLKYQSYIRKLSKIVVDNNKIDWNLYSPSEKRSVEICSTLVAILYNMCKVKIVEKSKHKDELNKINYEEINDAKENAMDLLDEMNLSLNSIPDKSSELDSEFDDDDDNLD